MKSVIINQYGNSGNLIFQDSVQPIPKSSDALVKVKACGVNHLDIWVRKGLRQCKGFPHIMGSEIAGESGKARVAVFPWLFCGVCKQCKSGNESQCVKSGTVGRSSDGGYAEYVVVPKKNLVGISNGVSFEEAAAVVLSGTTAHRMVIKSGVKKGDFVLIVAAGSGVGSLAVQICRFYGARVIAAVGNSQKALLAKKLGAEFAFTYDKMKEESIKITGGRGVDKVFELVGKDTFNDSLESLAFGGVLVTCGAVSGSKAEVDVNRLFQRQVTIMGSSGGNLSDMQKVLELVAMKKVKPVISKVFPLVKANAAHDLLESRKFFGKILLKP